MLREDRRVPPIGLNVPEFLDAGYEEWAQRHNYGSRWSVEGVFSSMKRIFGESVKATSINGMFHELPLKFSLYNILINC